MLVGAAEDSIFHHDAILTDRKGFAFGDDTNSKHDAAACGNSYVSSDYRIGGNVGAGINRRLLLVVRQNHGLCPKQDNGITPVFPV
jgi:hypothetical protein